MTAEAVITRPLVARTRTELADALDAARSSGSRVGLVPTMGALHEGHRSLMASAREQSDVVVVSIFVNPLQFGPHEDLDRYPRTFDRDLEMCREQGVAVVFAPTPDDMYPEEPYVTVSAGRLGELLEGTSRPGHFDGVLTVVAKLFHLVQPQVAVFGQKDAQQLALIRQMVRDLDMAVTIVGAPTVRERDGLALSSRNRYLSAEERLTAVVLSRALRAGEEAVSGGADAVRDAATGIVEKELGLRLDYLALVDPSTLIEVDSGYSGEAMLLVAGWVGTTRLIDNVSLTLDLEAAG